jgi:DNA-binding PadR family transcriptional regulator
MCAVTEDLDRKLLYGNLETLVLAALEREPMHGYRLRWVLAEQSGSEFQVTFGRLYPLLASLRRRGLVSRVTVKAGPVRERRVYSLTALGRAALDYRRAKWRRFAKAMAAVVG